MEQLSSVLTHYFTEELSYMLTQYFVCVHSAAAYWNLIAEDTNPVRRNRTGPFKEGGWKPCRQRHGKGKLNK